MNEDQTGTFDFQAVIPGIDDIIYIYLRFNIADCSAADYPDGKLFFTGKRF